MSKTKVIINLNDLPKEISDKIVEAYLEKNEDAKQIANMKGDFIEFEESYYGGCFDCGTPIKTRIIAYYTNPKNKKSGVIEFKHVFYTLNPEELPKKEEIKYSIPCEDLDKIITRIKYMQLETLLKDYESEAMVIGNWNLNFSNKEFIRGTTDVQLIQIETIKKLLGYYEKREEAFKQIKNKLESREFEELSSKYIKKLNDKMHI